MPGSKTKASKVSLPENLRQNYYVGDTRIDNFSWHISFHNDNSRIAESSATFYTNVSNSEVTMTEIQLMSQKMCETKQL
jgi:hypothetical protein